ncbi:MAG: BON domain-containing protein [Pirellulaceae bacterium]|nr:BON domain-containing protein [Planctomycetales bacterium]
MRTLFLLMMTVLLAFVGSDREVQAQLFGNRSLGQPLQRQSGPPGLNDLGTVGQVQGNERFMRGNRGRASFVGADQRDTSTFVGAEQGRTAGTIISSTAAVQTARDRTRELNQPLPPNTTGMYSPQLILDFPTVTRDGRDVADQLTRQIADSKQLTTGSQILVSVAGRTATLQGVVASARERELVELLVLFEPGISQVQNQLQVGATRR